MAGTGDPAVLLLRAAKSMRDGAERCGDAPGTFVPAVAVLLESFASCECDEDGDHWPEKSAALAVARAYLGETEGAGR